MRGAAGVARTRAQGGSCPHCHPAGAAHGLNYKGCPTNHLSYHSAVISFRVMVTDAVTDTIRVSSLPDYTKPLTTAMGGLQRQTFLSFLYPWTWSIFYPYSFEVKKLKTEMQMTSLITASVHTVQCTLVTTNNKSVCLIWSCAVCRALNVKIVINSY